MPLIVLLLPKSCTEAMHNMHTANRHQRDSGEKNGAQRRKKVSFDTTMMQALKLLQLTKRHVLEQSNVEQ